MTFAAPLGMSSFKDLRRAGAVYVDKTASMAALLRAPVPAVLFPRPRRFGKTLWLSTLAAWVEPGADAALFEGLAIADDTAAKAHFGRHPVLSVSLKDVKCTSWPECEVALAGAIAKAAEPHRSVLDTVSREGRAALEAVMSKQARSVALQDALRSLTGALHAHYDEQVVLLIDEYDTPIHAAYAHGYYDEAIVFFRNLLSGGLKDNPAVFRGVLTGILRVAKESIFSGLNNLIVYSILDDAYADAFGFVDDEVRGLAEAAEASDRMPDIRAWYNGYRFGGATVYNPWSVLNFLEAQPDEPCPYWVNTAADDLIRSLLLRRAPASLGELEALVRGETSEQPVSEFVVLRDIDRHSEALWSFLLLTGYLTVESRRRDGMRWQAALRVPNREVLSLFRHVFLGWLERGGSPGYRVEDLLAALLTGDAEAVEWLLTGLLVDHWSYHDGGRLGEAVYHAFVIGLLVRMADDYRVESNREAGFGRADVLLTPRQAGRPGVVMELKVPRRKSPEGTLREAMDQLAARRYADELRARGASPVVELGVVFDGKQVWVDSRVTP